MLVMQDLIKVIAKSEAARNSFSIRTESVSYRLSAIGYSEKFYFTFGTDDN